ncbi:MAG: hypothetical protein J7K57_07040 [Palaeococcus sp.]|uniref:hypothetical protein n=1 Tax=Palaeococcus sp. (in: euryarchaeotes) TaxID=2820298 RepID=UPI0025DD9FFF|nr:hypothetical protein [Palaeococcus sp. (in: euryarchaeotes)]MCD6559604.1 hypothetical protein [Palaeococcus sp. (in: euryarchaeotes)]
MNDVRKLRFLNKVLIFIIAVLLILSGILYYINREENGKNVRRNSYMATVLVKYAVEKAYYIHERYNETHNFTTLREDKQEIITLLNFSISVLKDARKRCESLGWPHLGLDNNIAAYQQLRDFLFLNWGNSSKVIPVTSYIKDHFDVGIALGFNIHEAECCFNYNYDSSNIIEEGLKRA